MSKKTYKDYPKRIVKLACLMYWNKLQPNGTDDDQMICGYHLRPQALKECHLQRATEVFNEFFRPRMAAMNKELQILRKYKAEHKQITASSRRLPFMYGGTTSDCVIGYIELGNDGMKIEKGESVLDKNSRPAGGV